MCRAAKLIKTLSGMLRKAGVWEMRSNGLGVSVLQDEKVLEMDYTAVSIHSLLRNHILKNCENGKSYVMYILH